MHFWEGWLAFGSVAALGAHKLTKALPETCGEQAVDDGVDGRAEVEEHTRQDVETLVDDMHQVCPLADGTPQQAGNVEGRPADPEHCHHNGWEEGRKEGRKEGRMDKFKDVLYAVYTQMLLFHLSGSLLFHQDG